MRRLLAVSPLIVGLTGCIDSGVDLSASMQPAFPLAEGYYQPVDDPKSPPFKVIRSGDGYRAIDPKSDKGEGAVFTLMDPDHTGVFIAEDKTSSAEIRPPRYVYYFVRVSASGDRVDLYDFTEADWRESPADLKERLKPGAGVTVVNDADAAEVLRAIEHRLAMRPTLQKTTFRLVQRIDAARN